MVKFHEIDKHQKSHGLIVDTSVEQEPARIGARSVLGRDCKLRATRLINHGLSYLNKHCRRLRMCGLFL